MRQLATSFAHLLNAYQCAIEVLGSSGERTQARLDSLCDHFAAATGIGASERHAQYKFDAWCIAKCRYLLDSPATPEAP
jgi:hypothetical protein